MRVLIFSIVTANLAALPADARLGETEAQSSARYGASRPEFIGPEEKALLEGAKQHVYYFEGWRIRVAFLDDVAVRMEYIHIPDQAQPQKITEKEVETILEAEKGKFNWREIKPRTGYKELNALKTAFEGRQWKRSDQPHCGGGHRVTLARGPGGVKQASC